MPYHVNRSAERRRWWQRLWVRELAGGFHPETPGRCYAGGHAMDPSTLATATATALAAPGAAPLALAVAQAVGLIVQVVQLVVALVLLVGLLALTRTVGKR